MTLRLQLPLGALGLVFFLAQSAVAQIETTVVGEISATIDGAPYVGETLFVPSEGTSTAEFRSFGPATSITVQAHDQDADSIMRNVLTLEMTLMGSDVSASIMESTASWWPEGMGEPFYHSESSQAELEVALDTLSIADDEPAITGSFSAILCRKDSFFAEPDLSDCLSIEGTFDTALLKAD